MDFKKWNLPTSPNEIFFCSKMPKNWEPEMDHIGTLFWELFKGKILQCIKKNLSQMTHSKVLIH